MGAWGSSLYANDVSSDVRDTYMKYLQDQLSNQEAYELTLKAFDGIDDFEEDAPLFWYALADTQWRTGRLMQDVKVKALYWIDKKGGMELWDESETGGKGWQKTLDKLKDKLLSEQPKERRVRKPVLINQNQWNLGDVYAYQFHTETSKKFNNYGKYIVIQKVGEIDNAGLNGETIMRVCVYDRIFENNPSINDIKNIRLLPFNFIHARTNIHGYKDPNPHIILRFYTPLGLLKKRNYPENNLIYLGNTSPIKSKKGRGLWSWGFWEDIEEYGIFFQVWKGIEYEKLEEGVFVYKYLE